MTKKTTRPEKNKTSLETVLSRIKAAAQETGAYQLKNFRIRESGWGDKKSSREYVSAVDIESEHQLQKKLLQLLPESSFYGEETSQNIGEGYTWIVDPLDGTTNYISGHDHWTISIALQQKIDSSADPSVGTDCTSVGTDCNKLNTFETVLGLVYRPLTEEFFTAIKGKGAWYNGSPLQQRPALKLSQALLGTGFPYRSKDTAKAFFSCAEEMLYACRGLRRCGSAALDIAYVGAGFLQGFWEVDLQPYDIAAALLIAEETGCLRSDFSGKPHNIFTSSSLAVGVPGVQEEMQKITQKHYSSLARIISSGEA